MKLTTARSPERNVGESQNGNEIDEEQERNRLQRKAIGGEGHRLLSLSQRSNKQRLTRAREEV